MMPVMQSSFSGTYRALIATVGKIYMSHRNMRLYSLRAAFSFGCMMAIWSCMAFHLAGEPFHAGSDMVGLLGLCGVAGAVAASGVGKYIPRYGITKISCLGHGLQLSAWLDVCATGIAFAFCSIAITLLSFFLSHRSDGL